MKKIILILSIFSFLSLPIWAQKTEVSENFDAMTNFTGNWAETGSGNWTLSTTSLNPQVGTDVQTALYQDLGNSDGSIVYTYAIPENPVDGGIPSRTVSFYWQNDMSLNSTSNFADIKIQVEASDDNITWGAPFTIMTIDNQTDFNNYVVGSKSEDATPTWAEYSIENASTMLWYNASIPINNGSAGITASTQYIRITIFYDNITGGANAGGDFVIDELELVNSQNGNTVELFEDFNNISFNSGDWTETNVDGMYGWVDSTFAYDINAFAGNTNGAFIEGTNLGAQDETITYTHNLANRPNTGVEKWELSFFWRTDMSLNDGNNADITMSLATSTDGSSFPTTTNFWQEDDQTIFESTVDGANSQDITPTWAEYSSETSGTMLWYHAKVDLTSYIGTNVKAIKIIINYKGQFAGDFMLDGMLMTKTANPEYTTDFALNSYETVALEQVDPAGYTINYSIINNGDSAANSNTTVDLHINGPAGTYNGGVYKQIAISTAGGADMTGSYLLDPEQFIQAGTDGTNIVGDYTYWLDGSITTSSGVTTTFNQGNTGETFRVDLNKYNNFRYSHETVIEQDISEGFGSVFYLRNTDHFKGIYMDRTLSTQGNKVKYYLFGVDDLNATNPVFIYESDPNNSETQEIATMDDHIKLSNGYYLVFVTAYDGDLEFNTDTTEKANTAYFNGKPNSYTKVTGNGDIALGMLLRENQAFTFSTKAGMIQDNGSLVLTEGVKVDFNLLASDPDDDAGTFSLNGAPSWVSLLSTDTTTAVSMLPTRFDVGTYSFSIEGTDGKVADNYTITTEVKDTKILDATTDNYYEDFTAFGDWTNSYDLNLAVTETPPAAAHWTVTGGHMQIACDQTRLQKEVLYTPLYGVPTSGPSDKLYLFFTWQFDNLSNTGAANIADIKIDMYEKGGTFVSTLWQDDDTTTIATNTVSGQHFGSAKAFNAEDKIGTAYAASTEYTTMLDLSSNITDSVYFVITYTSIVTSASQIPTFWFDNFKINYVPAELDLKVDNNSGYPENKYTILPLYQSTDLVYSVDVENLSNVSQTGNQLVGKITNSANSDQLYENTSFDVSPFATTMVSLSTKLNPREIGTYTFNYGISDDEGTELSGSSALEITANELALDDNGVSNWVKQNATSNGMGNKFVIRKKDYLKKVKAMIKYTGTTQGYTFSLIKEGTPNSLIWTSKVFTVNPNGAWQEYDLADDYQTLDSGSYYLMINDLSVESSGNLEIGVDDNADNMGQFYRGDLNTVTEAMDYDNTTYPDYKGDLMLRMILYNDAPVVVSVPDQNATENEAFSVVVGASDEEGGAISMNVTNMPTWLSFDAGTFTFSGTPTGTDAGDHYVEFYASDGRDSTAATFKINVVPDPLPFFTSIPVTELVEGQTYSYTAHAADFNAQTVTITTEGTLPTGLSGTGTAGTDATFTISGTLAVGQYFVQLRATDSNGGFVIQSFIIVVSSNAAPYFISEGIDFAWANEQYNLNIAAKDDNASDVLAITAKTTLPTWLTLTDNGDGSASLSGIPADSVVGNYTIKLLVTDNFSATDSLIFDLTVEARAKPVISAIADSTVNTGQVYSVNVMATDANNDEIVISTTKLPNWLNLAGTSSGNWILHGTPTAAGTYDVELIASDGYMNSDAISFTITVVDNPNTAPIINSTAITTATTGTDYLYTITATDADADMLRFIGTNIPTWLNIQDNLDGTADLFGSPLEANIGSYSVTVGVTDGNNIVEQTFTIDVVAGTSTKKASIVNIYPNPAVNYLTVENAEKASIKVFSISGKLIKEISHADANQIIDFSDCAHGIYIMHITTETETIREKINIIR